VSDTTLDLFASLQAALGPQYRLQRDLRTDLVDCVVAFGFVHHLIRRLAQVNRVRFHLLSRYPDAHANAAGA
jgi:hypothetical protein